MATPEFHPTHVVPQDGLPAWEAPDVSRPTDPLDPLLPVQLLDRRGDWGRIVCANGWSAWVDGRLLVSVPQGPPSAGQPLARTADPRPLLARVEESLGQYRRAAQDLAEGRSDQETFHRRTRGLRVGMVVDGESVWLYDAEHERWVFCDGTRLTTYSASGGPGSGNAPAHNLADAPESSRAAGPEPTRVVVQERADQAPGDTAGPEPTQVVDPVRMAEHGPADSGPTQLVKPVDGTGGAQWPDGHPPTRAGDR